MLQSVQSQPKDVHMLTYKLSIHSCTRHTSYDRGQFIGVHSFIAELIYAKAAITSEIKHAIKLAIKHDIIAVTTSSCNKGPARLAQLLQPSIALFFLQPMTPDQSICDPPPSSFTRRHGRTTNIHRLDGLYAVINWPQEK